MARALLVLVVAATLAAGCAAGSEQAEPPPLQGVDRSAAAREMLVRALEHRPARVVPVPAGFRLRELRGDRLGIAVPHGWRMLSSADARFPGVQPMFAGINRALGAAVAALGVPDGPMKLLAFDPRFAKGFATTATLMAVPRRAGVPYAVWAGQAIAYTRKLDGLRGRVRSTRLDHALGDAVRLEYVRASGPRDDAVVTVQYVVASGDRTLILSYSTLPSLLARYERLFEASAATLRVVG